MHNFILKIFLVFEVPYYLAMQVNNAIIPFFSSFLMVSSISLVLDL